MNYRKTECRLAYLYIVAAANANTFKWLLSNDNKLRAYVMDIAKKKGGSRFAHSELGLAPS